jgi:hypothetical protein
MTSRLLRRCHMGLHRHQDPRRRSLRTTPTHRCLSRGASGKASVIDLSSSSNEEDLIAATSHDFEFVQILFGELNCVVLGRSVTVRLSSSATLMKRIRLLLLQSTLPQPPPSTSMTPLRGQKMIIVMIRTPIRRLAVTTATEMTSVSLRLPCQEGGEAGVLQGEL